VNSPVHGGRAKKLYEIYLAESPSWDADTKIQKLMETINIAIPEGELSDTEICRLEIELKCIDQGRSRASQAQLQKIALIAGVSLGILTGGLASGLFAYVGAVPAGTIVTYVTEMGYAVSGPIASIPTQIVASTITGGVIGGVAGAGLGDYYRYRTESRAYVPSADVKSEVAARILEELRQDKTRTSA